MRLWTVCILALLPGLGWADGAREVVPISQTTLPDGDIRYSVPVRLGNSAALPALLDTGSTGLRVLRAAVGDAGFTDTGFASLSEFGGGDKLLGTVGTAVMSVGGESTDEAEPFEIVTQAGCAEFRPNCGASMVAPQDYGIGGDGIAGQGFQAILGVSLAVENGSGYLVNPLAHIGARRWIVTLPEPGQSGDGSLILNPDEQDLQGFQTFSLTALPSAGDGFDSGWEDTLAGCLNNMTTGQDVCGPAILDTGSPGIIAFQPGAPAGPLWSQNDRVVMSFASGNNSVSFPFVADRNPGTGIIQEASPDAGARLLDGFLPFYYFDVLYDAADGTVGLRPRADAPSAVTAPAGPETSSIEVIQINAPAPGSPPLPVVITPSQ